MRYARHFYALAKRITVEGGNQPRVKVANVIFLPPQPLVNKIEWNKFHFVGTDFLGMKIPLYVFFSDTVCMVIMVVSDLSLRFR